MIPIFETINIHGNEFIINFNYITHIEYKTINRPNGNPCCGEKGDTMIVLSMAHSADWIKIACDHDGNDITEEFIKAYKEWGYLVK